MRLTKTFVTLFAATILSLAACGSSGDDAVGDDVVEPDADITLPPDADTTAPKQLGDTCVPDAVTPGAPGDCGPGMACLTLTDGSNPWCSRTCTPSSQAMPMADTCNTGYAGAGVGVCFWQIEFSASDTRTMCGIICNDLPGDPMVCPAGECTDTCPATLACTAQLGGPPAVAEGCQ